MMVLFGSWEPFSGGNDPDVVGNAKFTVVSVIAIWGGLVIGGVYMLRAIRNIWHGEKQWPALKDPQGFFGKLPYVLLLGCLILLGCFPRLLSDCASDSVRPIVEMASGGPKLAKKVPPRRHQLQQSVLRSELESKPQKSE